MSVREEIMRLVEELPEGDLATIRRLLRGIRLLDEAQTDRLPPSAEARRAKAREVYGKYAHTHTSVAAFLARKREEVELEEERYRRRHPEQT
ncbi:MAG: hypothetical protein HY321_19165 [Armatimonadetes bacterium]|nr:hypothetical protein [Armatimonadota bacterium]